LLILPFFAASAALAPRAAYAGPASQAAAADEASAKEALARRKAWLESAGILPRAPKKAAKQAKTKPTRVFKTRATWYGPGFHGRRTASGERFNQHAMTLASRHLPFGTRVRVVNPKNGKSVVGRVNDRGPFVRGYGVDLSRAMARKLGLSSGPVRVEVLPRGK
jgi:rare lipoprotein A